MKSAILVVDVQNDYCASDGKLAKKFDLKLVQEMAGRLNLFLEQARKFVPIFFIRMDKSFVSIPKNLAQRMKEENEEELCVPGTKGFEYYKVKPREEDKQFVKSSYDAFTNKELSKSLKEFENLIIIGCYTDICVDATMKSAFSKGYNIIIPEDLVTSVNKVNLATLRKFAKLTTSTKILNTWKETYINQKLLIKEEGK